MCLLVFRSGGSWNFSMAGLTQNNQSKYCKVGIGMFKGQLNSFSAVCHFFHPSSSGILVDNVHDIHYLSQPRHLAFEKAD